MAVAANSSHSAEDPAAAPTLPAPSQAALVRRLMGLAWQRRGRCAKVVCQHALLVGLAMSGLGLTGLGIDVIRHAADPASVAPRWPLELALPDDWGPLRQTAAIAGAIVAVAAVHTACKYWAALTSARLVNDIVVQLRSDVYEKLQRLAFRFYDAHPSGSIINRVTGDVQAVRMFVDGVLIQVLAVTLSLSVYLAYMCQVHVGLTAACLATTPLLWVASAWFARLVRPMYVRNSGLADDLVLALSENFQGAQTVKGFAREREEEARFAEANRRILASKQAIFWRVSIYQPLTGMLTQLNLAVLLGYGGWLVIRGDIRLGEGLFVFANLLQQFATQVGQIANIANSIQQSLTGAQRVFEVLDTPVEISSPQRPVRHAHAAGGVRFERVRFGYRPGQCVLHDIDFEIRPGQCVAIVGPTGAGKSTLLSLIPRLYDPTSGRVLLDGHDVRDLHVDELRRQIGLVFQDSFLFCNTVAANIAFGRPGATQRQIERAARLAAIHHDILAFSRGYDTLIGEHGVNLSGGQRQRLALARALLLEPPILVLDDSTAAIDPETEDEILASLDGAMAGRTTFVVAHRVCTLRRADLAIVLDRGRIVQTGRHADLLAQEGHYRQSARLQAADAG